MATVHIYIYIDINIHMADSHLFQSRTARISDTMVNMASQGYDRGSLFHAQVTIPPADVTNIIKTRDRSNVSCTVGLI